MPLRPPVTALILAAALVAGSAVAQSWSSLTPAQRTALAPLERDWASIDADRKQKWLQIAARFPSMPPDERQRVQARMTEWTRMTPQERGAARIHYQEARELSPAERQQRWQQYQALPPDQRRQLAERASTPPERGRGNGADSARPGSPVPKSNVVPPTPRVGDRKPVAPTVVQAESGATTTLMSKRPAPPHHQQAGMPKIAASPGFVDRKTLLPQRGPQAAAAQRAASSPAR